jgi:hypothetical protein
VGPRAALIHFVRCSGATQKSFLQDRHDVILFFAGHNIELKMKKKKCQRPDTGSRPPWYTHAWSSRIATELQVESRIDRGGSGTMVSIKKLERMGAFTTPLAHLIDVEARVAIVSHGQRWPLTG